MLRLRVVRARVVSSAYLGCVSVIGPRRRCQVSARLTCDPYRRSAGRGGPGSSNYRGLQMLAPILTPSAALPKRGYL